MSNPLYHASFALSLCLLLTLFHSPLRPLLIIGPIAALLLDLDSTLATRRCWERSAHHPFLPPLFLLLYFFISSPWSGIALLISLGVLSHLCLDLLSGDGVGPTLPSSLQERSYHPKLARFLEWLSPPLALILMLLLP